MALAEKLVQRADIHIYKHATLFPFIKFYFVQLRKKNPILTTYEYLADVPISYPREIKETIFFLRGLLFDIGRR